MKVFFLVTITALLIGQLQCRPSAVEWHPESISAWPADLPSNVGVPVSHHSVKYLSPIGAGVISPYAYNGLPVATQGFPVATHGLPITPHGLPFAANGLPLPYNAVPLPYGWPYVGNNNVVFHKIPDKKDESPEPAKPTTQTPNFSDLDDAEPTTQSPLFVDTVKFVAAPQGRPEKLVQQRAPLRRKGLKKNSKLIASDIHMTQAVQQRNAKFIVEKIYFVPGRKVAQISSFERLPVRQQPAKLVQIPKQQRFQTRQDDSFDIENDPQTVVSSTGMTSADRPIVAVPSIEAYFPGYQKATNPNGDTTLIIEPSAKAVAGEGGTAISNPISRALIRKGTTTTVLFRPESVAIAGAGGTAHAQADLIIDYLDEDEE